MQKNWVDFAAVKAAANMEAVLRHYGIETLKRSGSELRGRCPIHKSESENSFHVNLDKNCFQCFAGKCKAKGNVMDFVAAMEQCSVRDAALKIAEWFSISTPKVGTVEGGEKTGSGLATEKREELTQVGESGAANKPLQFELKNIDPAHPYLTERGVTREIAELFGLGFFSGKGQMHNRIVIPIHNGGGELLAYAGRAIDGSDPKYKLPTGFHKGLELYNLHRLTGTARRSSTVVLVEGFFDCINVYQAGYPCVALMGCSLSERQEHLLRDNFTGLLLLFDGDEAGRQATDECLRRLGRGMWVKSAVVPETKQADQLTADELHVLLKSESK